MEKNRSFYWDLFKLTFYFNSVTFGGGYVIISLLMNEMVKKKEWLGEDEMLSLVSIAQSTPGPFAVNTCVLIGYHLAGGKGAFVTALGSILPPFIIIGVVSSFYELLRDNILISNIMKGMQAGIAAIILNIVINMAKGIIELKEAIPIIVMIISLMAAIIFNVGIVYILLFAGFVGVFTTLLQNYSEGSDVK